MKNAFVTVRNWVSGIEKYRADSFQVIFRNNSVKLYAGDYLDFSN
jgi:hypothetical protein